MSRLARKLLAGVMVAVAAGVLAAFGSASNAPAIAFVSPPSPSEGQTLTTNSVQFAFTYNRKPKATQSLNCDLSGPTSSSGPCDTPVADGKFGSSSGASYSGLADGSYTLTVTLTLTDGSTTSVVRHFTVAVCTGSEDFSEFPEFSQPTTFSGGTIDSAYGPAGGVVVQGSFLNGGFPDGAHVLFSGLTLNSFQLSFTNPVGSLQLDAQDGLTGTATTITLTAFDASNAVVGSDQAIDPDNSVNTLSVASSSDNITYFTVETNDPNVFPFGVEFTNIVWACA
jgi:hypothetical protein